jgi:Na+/H+-dicarboxylate symporter
MKDVPKAKGDEMAGVAFALIIGFILGLLVGFLMRSEAREFEADFGGHGDAKQ